MSYILVTGALGSKWSGVVRDIYKSKDIDQSDYKKNRVYKNKKVKHVGSYFDPHHGIWIIKERSGTNLFLVKEKE